MIEKRTRGASCSFKCQQGLQERKRQGRQNDREKDERVSSASRGSREENVGGAKVIEKRTRGASCSFKCQQGHQERKRQGRQSDREKDERVSSASRGSTEENFRSAKLTEKRTRGAPYSFKCKQGLQRRKRQGRQSDGEKDERGAM